MRGRRIYMQFILRPDRSINGETPLAVRLFAKGRQKVRNTGLYVKPADWNKEKQRANQQHELNLQLNELEGRFSQFQIAFHGDCNLDYCMSYIFNELITETTSIVQYVEEFRNEQNRRTDICNATKSRYSSVCNQFLQFLHDKGFTGILISEVSDSLIYEWDKYLQLLQLDEFGKRLSQNTRMKYHSMVRTMFIAAYNRRFVDRNPYAQYPLKSKPANRPFLSEQELQKMFDTRFSEPNLERIRLIFLFSCFTGIRFNDAQKLQKVNLQEQVDGWYLCFVVSKTGKQQVLPLIDAAKEILDQFEMDYAEELAIRNRLLPKISNQKFNKNLKVVAAKLGIQKTLSHHIARHTFATSMLNKGMKIEALQGFLGHSNIRETQIYAKISTSYLRRELNGIECFKFKLNSQ